MKKKINQFCSNQSQKCFFLKQSSCLLAWHYLMLYYNLFAYHLPSKVKVKSLSRVQLFATLWTVAYKAPQSMGFSRQEYWSGLPFPSPGDLSDPGIEPRSPALQADTLPSEPPGNVTQSTGSQRVRQDLSDPVCIHKRLFFFFFLVAPLPQ